MLQYFVTIHYTLIDYITYTIGWIYHHTDIITDNKAAVLSYCGLETQVSIGFGNGLWPIQHYATILTNAAWLSIGWSITHFSIIVFKTSTIFITANAIEPVVGKM